MNFKTLLFFLKNQKLKRIKQLQKLVKAKDIHSTYNFGLRLSKKYPKNAEVLYMTAWAAFQLKDFYAAISFIEKALKQNPTNTKYLNLRANAYLGLSNQYYQDSLGDFAEIFAREPDSLLAKTGFKKVALGNKYNLRKSIGYFSGEIRKAFTARDYKKCSQIIKELHEIDNIAATYWQLHIDDFLMRLNNPVKEWSNFIDLASKINPYFAFRGVIKKVDYLLKIDDLDGALLEIKKLSKERQNRIYKYFSAQFPILFLKRGQFRRCLKFLNKCEKQFNGDDLKDFKLNAFVYRYICKKMLLRKERHNTKQNELSELLSDEMLKSYPSKSAPYLILRDYLRIHKDLKKEQKVILADLRWNKNQANKFKNKILKTINNKTPFSLVRISDGEGYGFSKLIADHFSDNLLNVNEHHWWNKSLPAKLREKTINGFLNSLNDADMIGFPGPIRLVRDLRIRYDNFENPTSALVREVRYRNIFQGVKKLLDQNRINENAWWVDEICNTVFHHKDFLERLIKNSENVVLVTCFKVPRGNLLDSKKVKVIPIPAAKKVESVTDYDFGGKVLPEVINNIEKQIKKNVKSGTLLLVSAGFAGKNLVSIGKECGAVALDVGSAIDYIFGYKTRNVDFYSQF